MPFINIKVLKGTLSNEKKADMIKRVSETVAEIEAILGIGTSHSLIAPEKPEPIATPSDSQVTNTTDRYTQSGATGGTGGCSGCGP